MVHPFPYKGVFMAGYFCGLFLPSIRTFRIGRGKSSYDQHGIGSGVMVPNLILISTSKI